LTHEVLSEYADTNGLIYMSEDSGILQQPASSEEPEAAVEPQAAEENSQSDSHPVLELDLPEPEAPPVEDEMPAIVGVSFQRSGKIYHFRRSGVDCLPGDEVLARTEKGVDLGEVVFVDEDAAEGEVPAGLKPLMRKATAEDLRQREALQERERSALQICEEKIAAHSLPMKPIEAAYTFDARRLTFYFSAEERVDFRELVRDLAQTFHCRIELRQIGVRDEAKLIGGLGPCGRPLCCAQFLRDFEPVGIRLAKDQGLSLNPAKISGICDRLMCCLRYEHDTYQALAEELPKVGTEVTTLRGAGVVKDVQLLRGRVLVQFGEDEMVELDTSEVGWPGHELQAPEPEKASAPPAAEPAPAQPSQDDHRRGKRRRPRLRSRRQRSRETKQTETQAQQAPQAPQQQSDTAKERPARRRRPRRRTARSKRPPDGKRNHGQPTQ